MACTYCGLSASAALSAQDGSTSYHRKSSSVCYGRPPRDWRTGSWPTGCATTDYFRKHFTVGRLSPYYNVKCIDIIKGASCDPSGVGQHCMAAYLNILSKRVNFQTLESVRNMWQEWSTRGYYEPTAGRRWNSYDIVDYLKKTMD